MQSLIVNGFNACLSLYLFMVFAWWWHRKGDATKIYKVTCFLFFALFIHCSVSAHNYYRQILGEDLDLIAADWYVPVSKYLLTIAFIWYAGHITRKIFDDKARLR